MWVLCRPHYIKQGSCPIVSVPAVVLAFACIYAMMMLHHIYDTSIGLYHLRKRGVLSCNEHFLLQPRFPFADEYSEPRGPSGKPPSTERSDSIEFSLSEASPGAREESSEHQQGQELSDGDVEWSRVDREESSPTGMSVCASIA
jgi:hypothetical protein